ncbi:MAG TPA: carboxypeptidase-like regulatory domain-containing protein [Kofleriaceae bacterium]|jgi:protocatechuate 3,4-dioxygenase beta subunit
MSPRLRIALLGVAAVAAIVALLVVATREPWTPSVGVASGSAVGLGSGKAAIHAPPTPQVPGGDPTGVRLTGFVVDGAGQPVVGAEVTAEMEKGAADPALAGAPSEAGVDAAESKVLAAAPTGSDGRFVIGGLEAGRFRVRVTGTGLLPAEVRFVPVPSDATRIVVARQVSVTGIVLDEGAPAPGVMVGLRGDAIGGGIERKTGVDGTFAFNDLPEGRYQLYAFRGSLAARAVRVNRLGVGPFAAMELRLEPATIVVGRVVDRDDGTPLAAAIELRPSGDDQAPRYARTGIDGVFKIEGVPDGKWIVDAYAPGYVSPGGVELDAGKAVPELALARGATVEGKVVDGDGKPIANATVRALTTTGAGTDADSAETSEAVEQDRLRRYSGIVVAQGPVAGAIASSGDPNFVSRGELGVMLGPIPPLPPPGAASTRTATATVDPTMATLAPEPAPLAVDPSRASIWTTGPDGVYRIRGLTKGKVHVVAVAAELAEGRSKEINISASQVVSNVDVVLTPGTILVGKVTDQRGQPVAGAQVSATSDSNPLDAFTDSDGAYRLGPLAGTVTVTASAYGHGEASREIDLAPVAGREPAERTEDFTLEVADASLSAILDDANGTAVAGAQVEVISKSAEGRRAVTAADGTFVIEQLPAGPLRVRIRHPNYPLVELPAVAKNGLPERQHLVVPLGGAIEGAVVEAASGSPLASVLVTGTGPDGGSAEATTDKAGLFHLGPLAPGAWKLTVSLPGFLAFSRDVDVPVAHAPGDVSVRDVRLELARGALLAGTVRDSHGQRLAGAAISVRSVGGDGPTAEATTDANGEFKIRDAPTGDLIVGATKDGAGGSVRATVRPGDEILGLSIDVR